MKGYPMDGKLGQRQRRWKEQMLVRSEGSKGAPLFPRAVNSSHRHSPWSAFKALPPSTKAGTQAMFYVPVDEFRMALAHHDALGGPSQTVLQTQA